jgi:hypothetical protein
MNIEKIAQDEVFVPVVGIDERFCNSYLISNYSRVYSLKSEKILSPSLTRDGYHSIGLCSKGRNKTIRVHRLSGFAFVENPFNKPFINHKDGNKLNNYIGNFEWSTNAENIQHGYDNNLIKNTGRKKGDTHSDETKTRMSKARIGKGCGIIKKVRNTYTGTVFNSVKDAIADSGACAGLFYKKIQANEPVKGIIYEYV